MYERHHEPLLPRRLFVRRLARHALLAGAIIAASLGLGVLGYHFCAGLPWIDAFLDASMILSGMGPVEDLQGNAAKTFAGLYALFSGIVFLSTVTVLVAPLVHRLMHRFHMIEEPPDKWDRKR